MEDVGIEREIDSFDDEQEMGLISFDSGRLSDASTAAHNTPMDMDMETSGWIDDQMDDHSRYMSGRDHDEASHLEDAASSPPTADIILEVEDEVVEREKLD